MTDLRFPPHKGSLHLVHNEHRMNYETVAKCASHSDYGLQPCWVSEEQRLKAIATDELWTIQWYPDSPVGFFCLWACDLDVLLASALVWDS
jgi:hypothetical protein